MNEANFVSRISSFVTGDSFLAEREIPLAAIRDTTNGLSPLGEATGAAGAPAIDGLASIDGIGFVSADDPVLQFQIPQDYEEGKDQCALRFTLVASASNGATSMGLGTPQKIFRSGVAVDSTAVAAIAGTSQAAGVLVHERVLDIGGRSYKPGDVVQITLDPTAAGGDTIVVLGMSLIYGSCLRAFNNDDNERNL